MTAEQQDIELIALFDGWIEKNNNYKGRYWKFDNEGFIADEKHLDQMKYHSSWDWLMPVAIKINTDKSLQLLLPKNDIGKSIYPFIEARRGMLKGLMNTDIKQVYIGVISFINWYNQQTTNG